MLNPKFKADCDAVGCIIVPPGSPPWLTEYLVHWSSPTASNRSVDLLNPSKATMNKKLTDIGNAAQLLNDMLSDPMVKAFLELESKFEIDKEFVGFRSALPLIAARAYRAATSPAISNKAGKAKSGRGKFYSRALIIRKSSVRW